MKQLKSSDFYTEAATLAEDQWIDELGYIDDYIVRLKIVEGDSSYYTNEFLRYTGTMPDGTNEYEWASDWWEGQEKIYFVGAIPLHKIDIPEGSDDGKD